MALPTHRTWLLGLFSTMLLVSACRWDEWLGKGRPYQLLGSRASTPECSRVMGVTQDQAHLYWVEVETTSEHATVVSLPKAGGPIQALATASNAASSELASDEGHVYWLYQDPQSHRGTLLRISKEAGATPVVLSEGEDDPSGLLRLGDELRWASRNELRGVRAAGGEVTTVARSPKPHDCCNVLAREGTDLYWMNGTWLFRVAKPAGAPTVLAQLNFKAASLAVEGSAIFVHRAPSALGQGVYWLPKSGGLVSRITQAATSMAVVDGMLYWADNQRTAGRLFEASTPTGAPRVAALLPAAAQLVQADSTHIFAVMSPTRVGEPWKVASILR